MILLIAKEAEVSTAEAPIASQKASNYNLLARHLAYRRSQIP